MSKLNHLLTALPDPKENYIKEINNIFFKFLWTNKPDKINRKTVEMDYAKGGIKMINLRNTITSFKATWVRRLLINQNFEKPLWIELFEKVYNTTSTKFSNFGTYYPVMLKNRTKNLFWGNVFDAWVKLSGKQNIENGTILITSPLWYNINMPCKEMYLPKWYEKGIVTIADVTDNFGNIMDLDTIKSTYGIETINPLHYLRVQQNIKMFLRKYGFTQVDRIHRPFVPIYMRILYKNSKGASVFNKILNRDVCNEHSMKAKWQDELNIMIDEDMWKNIFYSCFKTVCNNTIIWFQTRLLYRILGTRTYLYKLHIGDSDRCIDCGEIETIVHMFVECRTVNKIWKFLKEYINRTIKISVYFDKVDILFGYSLNNQNKIPLSAIILITKKYIYDLKSRNNRPFSFNFDILLYRLKQTCQDELYLATLNNQNEKFNMVWKKWLPVFGITLK